MKNYIKISEIINSAPALSSLINPEQICTAAADEKPYFSDCRDYFEFIRASMDVKFAIASIKNTEKTSGDNSLGKQPDGDMKYAKYIKELMNLDSTLDEIYRARLEYSKTLSEQPIQVKLIQKLELNEIEIAILNFIISGNSGKPYYAFYNIFTVGEMAHNLNLSPEETLFVISCENKLVKYHIYDVSEVKAVKSQITEKQIKVPCEILKALLGFRLTAEEFLNIKGTVLEEFLKCKTISNDNQTNDGNAPRELNSDDENTALPAVNAEKMPSNAAETPEIKIIPESAETEENNIISEYSNDIEYLKDQLDWMSVFIKLNTWSEDIEDYKSRDQANSEAKLRELKARENMLKNKCEIRYELTLAKGKFIPKIVELCKIYNLCDFEKNIILYLIGKKIYSGRQAFMSRSDVQSILNSICPAFEDQIYARRYFYQNSTLVKNSIISISSDFFDDVNDIRIELDRLILDEIIGLGFEVKEMSERSSLYTPATKMADVIIEESQKCEILDTVKNFEKFKEIVSKKNIISGTNYLGNGLILMFYGPSGTGKTMMANAIANYMGKKILLINYPDLGHNASTLLHMIFREAKINDSIIFFDECEAIFSDRQYNTNLTVVLTEIERYDNIVIMATNRPQDIDEAMHRRIKAAFYFDKPSFDLREKIWASHIPKNIKIADDIDLKRLAYNYELTGGLIKNSVELGVNYAISRNHDDIILTQADLENGARAQLKGHLKTSHFEKKLIPAAGLESIVADEKTSKILKEIVASEKAKQYLFGKWGFSEGPAKYSHGTSILFYGEPGVGKTFAAEAIGYEMGQPIMRVNIAQLTSKWVGETSKNIETIFEEAQNSNAILLFDEADSLFTQRTSVATSTDKYSNMDLNTLLTSIENYCGIVILTTNFKKNMDKALFRRIRYVVKFEKPSFTERVKLWEKLLPAKADISEDVDFKDLARIELTGGHIKNAIFRAATKAVLRDDNNEKTIIQQDLLEAAEEEISGINPDSKKIGFDCAA